MNKTAICISGQIRNEIGALAEISKMLKNQKVDVFISVWKKRGSKTFGGANGPGHLIRILGPEIATAIPRNWVGRMRDVFPNSESFFPDLGDVTEKTIQKFFPDAKIQIEDEELDFSFPYSDSNSLRMLYKIWQCNLMKQSAEKISGQKYNKVIRLRPDISLDFNGIIDLTLGDKELLTHAHRYNVENYTQDIYWAGSSDVDDYMAECYLRAKECKQTGWHGIHLELYRHTIRGGLEVVPRNFLAGTIESFCSDDPEYDKIVQDNFVNAVIARAMDVDFAGGEHFCAIAEKTIKSALAQTRGGGSDLDIVGLIDDISNFSRSNKKLRDISYLLGAFHIVCRREVDFVSRLGFLLFAVELVGIRKMTSVFDSFLGVFPKVFKGHELTFLNAFTGTLPKPVHELISIAVPSGWLSSLTGRGYSHDTAISLVLKDDGFCNWVMKGIELKGNEKTVINFALNREELGVKSVANYHNAAKACRLIKNVELETTFLSKINEIEHIWPVNARLAEIYLAQGTLASKIAARRHLEIATSIPTCPEWVIELQRKVA